MAAQINPPLALDDAAFVSEDAQLMLDVLANDRGGDAKVLHSADGVTALGATVSIADGQLLYDPSASPVVQALVAGQALTDTFTYALQVGYGAIAFATVAIEVTGTNDLGAGDITVQGASGNGGAFVVGDTMVVAVAPDGFAAAEGGVTVDFSVFGGPGTSTAELMDGRYVTSWVVTATGFDGDAAGVSVTVQSPLGDVVQAVSAPQPVDADPPAGVEPSDIVLTGASGNNGTFVVGDTMAVTISAAGLAATVDGGSVAVDFSAFGGPAAVPATEVAGGYFASYVLDAGAAGAFGAVGVVVSDGAGNTLRVDSAAAGVAMPDPDYELGSLTRISFTPLGDSAWELAVQPDGKVLIAGMGNFNQSGYGGDFAMARVNPDGSLDTGFGAGGIVVTDLGGGRAGATEVVLQDDGRIVLGGMTDGASRDFAMARYTSSGALDSSFGSGGIVRKSFTGGEDEIHGLEQLPDGSLLAGGYVSPGARDFAAGKFTASGAFDASYGAAGLATTSVAGGHDLALDTELLADGRLLLAGYAETPAGRAMAVLRYDSAGVLDAGFASGGIATHVVRDGALAYEIVAQGDGKLLLAGYSIAGGQLDTTIVRLNADGSLDTGFGVNGAAILPLSAGADLAYDVAVQADGRIVAVGWLHNGGDTDAWVARFNADGTLDTGFGDDGVFMLDLGAGSATATTVALSGDVIVVGGVMRGPVDDDAYVAMLSPM
ncbi:MAG: hypothetical protein HY854_18795 [Burkholderiales bacterium]|nr:hypothetical protein [Burkholderiales bacterium]